LTIGPERAAAALARTHRVASVVVPPEGRRGRIEEEAIVGGDLALTTDTTTVCTARFRLLSRNPLETDMSDLRIHATTALWTMPLADGRFLVLQGVDRVPPAVNTGEPLLRIGVLDPATRAVAWHGWLPLPAGTAPTRLLPGAGASAGRMMIGLVEGVAKRGGTEVGPNAWWCEFPAPEGVAFPPPPGRSQYAFHAHEYR
ncbi:MAG TPA: hypothetical protein VEI97_04000, partial [bacterium]|nr:hypothetical protein [bacterium]